MENQYVKSAIIYQGGKYKLLPSIIPLFPDKINTFVDLFGGGFNVGINTEAKSCVYNDNCYQIAELLATMKTEPVEDFLKKVDKYIEEYELSKTNQDGYLRFRNFYNKFDNSSEALYTLICYSFNNQLRFNSVGDFNMPFGKDRSSFNPVLRQKFITFCEALKKKDCIFYAEDFEDVLNNIELTENDFVYCDPPYFKSVATYNESGKWTDKDEQRLYKALDELNKKGIKFALSNNLKYGNSYIQEWMKNYNVHYINADYNNCNYQKKDKSEDCEVLITNYEKER
jgi:DNA adenine methylase Dam